MKDPIRTRSRFHSRVPGLLAASALLAPALRAYDHFKVAVYCRAYEVRDMGDPEWLESRWTELARQVRVAIDALAAALPLLMT